MTNTQAALAVALTLMGTPLLLAGPHTAPVGKVPTGEAFSTEVEHKSVLDQIWNLPVLYSNEDNPIIQRVALIGRYQGQYVNVDSDRGNLSDWFNRRFRMGTKINFLEDFKFETEFNLQTVFSRDGRFVRNFDTLFIEWKPQDDFALAIGKIKPKITQEYHTSSKQILTFERSLLVDQTTPAKIYGLQATGKLSDFDYRLAGFTTGLDSDWLTPRFNSGYSLLAGLGKDISDATNVRVDYLFNDPSEEDFSTRDTKHLVSLNSASEFDRWGLNTDLIFARVRRNSDDLFGLVIMPYYDISDKLQAVLRYHFAASDGPDGIRSRSRYERAAIDDGGGTRGDRYHSVYAGLNYYIYDHKLKLMTGLEYANLKGVTDSSDWDGWTYLAGVRLYF